MNTNDKLRVRISRRGDAPPAVPFGGASIAVVIAAIALAQAVVPYALPMLLAVLFGTRGAIRTAEALEDGAAGAPMLTMAVVAYFLLSTGYVVTVFNGCFGSGVGLWSHAPRHVADGIDGVAFLGLLAVPVHVWKWLRARLVRNVGARRRAVVVYV